MSLLQEMETHGLAYCEFNQALLAVEQGVKEGHFKQFYVENGAIITESDQGFSIFYREGEAWP